MKDNDEWVMSFKEMIKDLFKKEGYRPKKLKKEEKEKLKKQFPKLGERNKLS